jgi:hypothetical protein
MALFVAASHPIAHRAGSDVPRWGLVDATFTSSRTYENPLQDAKVRVTFTAPSKRTQTVDGFWDGGTTWRVRFSPDEVGTWTYLTSATPESETGLHAQKGSLRVAASMGTTRLERHGPIRVAQGRTYLEHADGTPFFWLADTGGNAALLSTPEEFEHHIRERVRQRFTAVQWVATQWRAAPQGDRLHELAYTGTERIAINPAFFQAAGREGRRAESRRPGERAGDAVGDRRRVETSGACVRRRISWPGSPAARRPRGTSWSRHPSAVTCSWPTRRKCGRSR